MRTKAAQQPKSDTATETGLKDPGQPAAAEGQARAVSTVSSEKRQKRGGNPQVDAILRQIEELWGQKIVHWGKEVKDIKAALDRGYQPDDLVECWKAAQESPRWKGQWMPMAYLVEDVGEWLNNGHAALAKWRIPLGGAPRRVDAHSAEDFKGGWS
ncbi:MAG: hypothetical protein Q8O40_10005 [Chloroflexota bacterium]|nr:hypothetical protein [Chloroflexota bacterium]